VAVSRELKPVDISEFRKKFGYEPFSVPIAPGTWRPFGFLDAVGFFVHRDNPLKQLTRGSSTPFSQPRKTAAASP